MNLSRREGFTLIEILIVVAIIAILASVVLVGLGPTQRAGRDTRRISDLQEVQQGLVLYNTEFGQYPVPSGGSCLSSPWWNCWQSNSLTPMLPASIAPNMPQDPSFHDDGSACNAGDTGSKAYAYYSDGEHYILATRLENPLPTTNPSYYSDSIGCTGFANYAIREGL